ncbi:MAG: formylglycine-generating enzyme family protein [Polyangiaceae bacterium]|nr:formylglycine-generating enzyme family protein [Polyangiaceae bacterium]
MRRAFVLGLGLAGCAPAAPPPEGQLVVHVTTDAPLPAAPGQPPPAVPALFDRLELALYEPGAVSPCDDCRREVAVDHQLVDSGRASFGSVAPPGKSGYRLRVRLYRNAGTIAGTPRPASTIETMVDLPAVREGVVDHVTVMLRTDDVGKPPGPPTAALPGRPPEGWVGSFPGAARVPCAGAPPAGMGCVPGGAFWMGDPTLDTTDSSEYDGRLERLVVLSPFFVDASEVSVGAFRKSGLATSLFPGGPSDNPHVPGPGFEHCRYTQSPGELENHPVNCTSWDKARAYCESLGNSLPSEAQLEYLQSGLGRGPFVWGTEAPACPDAVFDREPGAACVAAGTGPAAVGSGARDRLELDSVTVVDLAGNLSEWASDQWNRETEACWGTGVFDDPRCETPSAVDPPARVMRGGGWHTSPPLMRAALRARLANETQAVSHAVGFRCVRQP